MTLLLLTLVLIPAPARAQDITTGLIGHWKLDETSGTTAIDYSSNNNGTMTGGLNGGDTADGRVDSALTFDGTDDYIDLGLDHFNAQTQGTVSAWIYMADLNTPNPIFSVEQQGHSYRGTAFYVNEQGNLGMFYKDASTNYTYVGDLDLQPMTWYHAVVTADGADYRLYINGIDEGTLTVTGGTAGDGQWFANNSSTPLAYLIGKFERTSPTPADGYFRGLIDDVRLYDRVLTAADIAELYQARPGFLRYNTSWRAAEYFQGDYWVPVGRKEYVPNAVNFTAATDMLELQNQNFPNTKKTTISFWFRREPGDPSWQYFFDNNESGPSIGFQAINDTSDRILFRGQNGSTGTVLLARTSVINDNNWHHIMGSFDLAYSSATHAHIYVDGVEDTDVTTWVDDVFTLSPSVDLRVGGQGGGPDYNGDIADMWVDYGTYIDLSNPANREKFYNNGPVYLGENGERPTGSAPEVFLSGNTDTWEINDGSGGDFTVTGVLTGGGSPVRVADADMSFLDNIGTAGRYDVDFRYGYLATANANGHDVIVFDAGDPSNLTQLDLINGISNANSVAFSKDTNYIYATTSFAQSLWVIDSSDKGDLQYVTQIGNEFYGGGDLDLSADGNTLYAASSTDDDFTIVDVGTNPANPSVIRTISDGTQLDGALDLDVVGNYAYVASVNANSLSVIDLSNPASASIIGYTSSASLLSGARAVQVSNDGNYAYVGSTGGVGAFTLVDVRTKTAPVILGAYVETITNTTSLTLDRERNRLFVGSESNDMIEVWDVSRPDSPEFLNSITSGAYLGSPSALHYENGILYVPDHANSQLSTIQLSDCANPARLSGTIVYNTTTDQMQFCNGQDWVPMGPAGDGGAGCTNPVKAEGSLVYNSSRRVMQYCEGSDWIAVGRRGDPVEGLVGYWRMDEQTGGILTDSSGNGNNATWFDNGDNDVDDQTVNGQVLRAIGFDGVDDEANAGSDSSIDNIFAGGGTIAAWIYPVGWGEGSYGRIAGKGSAGSGGSAFYLDNSNFYPELRTLNFGHTFNNTWAYWSAPTDAIALNQWQHVAVVYNKDNVTNDPILYINGIARTVIENATPGGTADSDATADFKIGNNDSGQIRTFDGNIDDVRVYNRALSASEIADLYLATGGSF